MGAEDHTGLRRGIAVLLALGEGPVNGRGLGVTEVAERLGREKSQVSRTLKVLAEHGLVDRDPDTLGYRLGWRLLALAAQGGDRRLLEAAGPALNRIVEDLGETAHLSVLRGAEVLTVASESPAHAVQAAGWVGRTVPVHCTSSGRVLLLDLDREEVDALFDASRRGRLLAGAPRSAETLRRRIAAARRDGFALVDEEFEPGLVAAAAPVRDFSGAVVAALNVSAPKFRFAGRLREAGHFVRAAAADVSAALGYAGDTRGAGAGSS